MDVKQHPELPAAFVSRFKADFPQLTDRVMNAMRETISPALNQNRRKVMPLPASSGSVAWNKRGAYLPVGYSPVFDPFWHGGAYYMMEAASQSVAHALASLRLPPNAIVLDLCAAPGGKSSVLLNELPDDAVLVSNEIIRGRANILYENAVKWGNANHVVSHSDPQSLAATGIGFDLILVDAPCSGEGMFRKDVQSRAEWSPENVAQCAIRQGSILTSATEMMSEGGYLIYSTCTFGSAENDDQIRALLATRDWEVCLLDFGSLPEADRPIQTSFGWQFLPGITKGEGLYISALQFTGRRETARHRITSQFHPFKGSIPFKTPFGEGDDALVTDGSRIWNMHPAVQAVANHLRSQKTPLLKAGIAVGNLKGKDRVPDHELAMWNALPAGEGVELGLNDALLYLRGHSQRGDFEKGWHLAMHQGHPLGWLKSVGNRWNNAYPQHWKLRS